LVFAACGQLSEAFVARSKCRIRISTPPGLAEKLSLLVCSSGRTFARWYLL